MQDELIPLNPQHRSTEMANLIADEVVETIGIVGDPETVVSKMLQRFHGVVSRTGFHVHEIDSDRLKALLHTLKNDN